jgi:GT2 family glycosyltransferase/tetratricopeptide (TPR) repeat protein/2-polyprenyl-3-methyl-5-hydroxy-6-metoxy-1,4-benzoquinol methylase
VSIRRVAVIFDNQSRPETTGTYCLRALGRLAEVEHFLPSQLDGIPRQGFDLYLNIDDGHDYRLPPELRPCAWWVIDTHLNFDWDRQKAADFDRVFAAQRDGAEQLRQVGIVTASWLPLACDPDIHSKHAVDKQFDLAFVGTIVFGPRSQLLALLQGHFPNTFVGRCYFEDMAHTYSAARLVFNCSIANDVNMRVFEALACGSLLLTNDLSDNGQSELFHDGVHLATYRDAEELLDKARFYLKREDVRERIAAAGRAEALARHTYQHRMEHLLREVEKGLTQTTVPTALPTAKPTERLDALPLHLPDARDGSYFDFPRPELLALVPTSARKVLDVGCGRGRLGETLKARQPAEVIGIEFNEEAAAVARTRLDRVLVGDVEQLQIDFRPRSFDAIICGDILEHLREPGRFLRRAREWLQPDGQFITSIPNVRHYSVVQALLRGDWTYTPAGLLDRDHLRFFTRREIEKLLYRSGFHILDVSIVPGADHADWQRRGRPGEVKVGRLHIAGMTAEDAEEFYVYQYLVRARPAETVDHGLTSIVLVTHNQLAYTIECLDSIRQHTDEPYELICVDNASTDGTVEYLRSLPGVRLLVNPDNRGFPAAANQGIRTATGSQVLLLNNDTVVTTGWLMRLLRALHEDAKVGLVGPYSNIASGRQRLTPSYEDLSEVDGFAWDWGNRHDGFREEVETLSGFCLLIRREVVDAVGLLDERFGVGCLEDDDYCVRARRAGYRTVLARDAFIHHFGHRTFVGNGIDFDALQQRNLQLFRAKWEQADGLSPHTLDCGLTSIVLVLHNQLDYTRQCVDSIRRNTDHPYELIFVDNASTDDTVEYLRAVPNSRLIANTDNRGFPAAANQGIQAATGQQVLLLNNDCVVPAGWLDRLLRALYSDPQIGLVGPCSNYVSGEQQVPVTYTEMVELDAFAAAWARDNDRKWVDTDRLVGFCLLIRRAVINKIGLLDERFGTGCFEDDDYSLRALQAGFRAVVARDAFVHHYGGRTFVGSGVDFAVLMQHNQQLFHAKWAKEQRVETTPAPSPITPPPAAPPAYGIKVAPGGGLLLVRKSIQLSLCMIVRDNARTIEATLRSIRPWVDEMIVVDTGSTDGTPQIAAQLGARVFHFPWRDSFAAARNESLRYARGRWIFWMDSDDTIDEANGRKLRELVERETDPSILGFVMQVHCPGAGDEGNLNVTVVDHVKLFRNLPHLRFTGRIHEQILPAIRRSGGETAWTDIFVVHSGYDHSPEGQERKKQRDLHLLQLELKEQPNHPFTLFNLGMTHADIGEYEKAIDYLRRSIQWSGEGESHLRKAYALLVYCHMQTDRRDEAEQTCLQGLRLFPQDVELRFRQAILLHESGRLAEAVQVYRGVLEADGERHFSSVDRAMRGFKGRQNLALVYADMGDWPHAEEQWRQVIAEAPRYRQGWRGLGEVLLRQGKLGDAEELAGRLLADARLRCEGMMLKGHVAIIQGNFAQARQDLQRAVVESSDDPESWQALCRFLFEHGEPVETAEALQELTRRDPGDASAFHNLGTVRMRLGQHVAAAGAYRRSLALRPRSPNTLLSLGYALRDSGEIQGAIEAWQQVLRLIPNQPEAAQALHEIHQENERGSQPNGNGASADRPERRTPGTGGRPHGQLGAGTSGPASG